GFPAGGDGGGAGGGARDANVEKWVAGAHRDGARELSSAEVAGDDDAHAAIDVDHLDPRVAPAGAIDLGEAAAAVLVTQAPETTVVGEREEVETEATELLPPVDDVGRETA